MDIFKSKALVVVVNFSCVFRVAVRNQQLRARFKSNCTGQPRSSDKCFPQRNKTQCRTQSGINYHHNPEFTKVKRKNNYLYFRAFQIIICILQHLNKMIDLIGAFWNSIAHQNHPKLPICDFFVSIFNTLPKYLTYFYFMSYKTLSDIVQGTQNWKLFLRFFTFQSEMQSDTFF